MDVRKDGLANSATFQTASISASILKQSGAITHKELSHVPRVSQDGLVQLATFQTAACAPRILHATFQESAIVMTDITSTLSTSVFQRAQTVLELTRTVFCQKIVRVTLDSCKIHRASVSGTALQDALLSKDVMLSKAVCVRGAMSGTPLSLPV